MYNAVLGPWLLTVVQAPPCVLTVGALGPPDATWSVEKAMKEGVQWVDMHDLSYRVILRHLAEAGLLTSVGGMCDACFNLFEGCDRLHWFGCGPAITVAQSTR